MAEDKPRVQQVCVADSLRLDAVNRVRQFLGSFSSIAETRSNGTAIFRVPGLHSNDTGIPFYGVDEIHEDIDALHTTDVSNTSYNYSPCLKTAEYIVLVQQLLNNSIFKIWIN